MRILITTLCLFMACWLTARAQETETPAFAKHGFGINISNGISSTLLGKEYSHLNTKVQYAASAALLYQYRPVSWFSLETGVEYNSTEFLMDYPYTIYYYDFVPPGPDLDLAYAESMQRWAVPLNLRWYYQHKKWGVYGLTGAAFTVDWQNTVMDQFNAAAIIIPPFRTVAPLSQRMGLAVTAGVGAEYQVSKRVLLRFEERFRVYDVVKKESGDDIYSETTYGLNRSTINDWALETNLGVYITL